jgi:mannose-6-phosphate isomerase
VTAPLFLSPAFQQRMWGGRGLATRFGYQLPDGPVGECWGISARQTAQSEVRGGRHAGRTLSQVWEIDRGFFGGGDPTGPFPLLAKFLDAEDWLSVQVHPDDAAAVELEGVPSGKDECWYVVAAESGAELILGHRAASRDELLHLVDEGRWDELLLRRPVSAGDFVYVPSGTVHAVGPGLLVYELQQNSDTTYRVWDFDRRDAEGRPRELHLDKAKHVLTAPYDAQTTDTAVEPVEVASGRRRALVSGPFFEVALHEVTSEGYRVRFPTYELCTVTAGTGSIRWNGQEHYLRAGDHLILPADAGEVRLDGHLTLVSSHPVLQPPVPSAE